MAVVFKCNSSEQLRSEIARYLDYIEDRERKTALSERKVSDGRARIASANLAQSLAMEIRGAIFHKDDSQS